MPRFERHIFVCGNKRDAGHPRGCCTDKGSEAIREALKTELEKRGMKGRIRANHAGCLDQCEHGPTLVVYPDGVWYGFVKREDVAEIVEKHLIGGEPVQRLMLPDGCLNTPRCPHRGGAVSLGGVR
ncbi:Ferredoxin, 2Fe-2S [Phycisphaerae bacterium RAS1]|nr:Ferredoxin, 2Fe-2S [Phycisphaerae bacterium RAS1]